jgi:hypothetical protein
MFIRLRIVFLDEMAVDPAAGTVLPAAEDNSLRENDSGRLG